MLKLTITSKTKDPLGEILAEIKKDVKLAKEEVNQLGYETLKVMKDYIHDSKVRPQAGEPTKLENALEVELFNNGWGIGDIERLKSEAPGWAALNFGSSHMVGKSMPPYFTPGSTKADKELFRQGRVNYNGKKGSNGPIVKNAIEPINYIERAVFWLTNQFSRLKG